MSKLTSEKVLRAAKLLEKLERALLMEHKLHSGPRAVGDIYLHSRGFSSDNLRSMIPPESYEEVLGAVAREAAGHSTRLVQKLLLELDELGVERPALNRSYLEESIVAS